MSAPHTPKEHESGFTIIEVLIVLAIAGLIALIILLAVPALQRNSRNNQRRNEVGKLSAAISNFLTANNNVPPATGDVVDLKQEASITFFTEVTLTSDNTAVSPANTEEAYIKIGGKCNDTMTNVGGSGASGKNIAVVYFLETGNTPAANCQQVQ